MDDWAWDDPAELRIRLDVALEHNAMLAAEIAELRERLRAAESAPSSSGSYPARADDVPSADRPTQNAEPPRVDTSASIEAKIALFRSLFAGRDDVYARRWTSSRTGRSGWIPAEADPFDRTLADADRTFFPLTDKAIFDHLSRQPSPALSPPSNPRPSRPWPSMPPGYSARPPAAARPSWPAPSSPGTACPPPWSSTGPSCSPNGGSASGRSWTSAAHPSGRWPPGRTAPATSSQS